jgi:hypothetical protein
MNHVVAVGAAGHLALASRVLGLTHGQLANMLGVSLRTVARWYAKQGGPVAGDFHTLARAVHPRDPDVAARLAAAGGTTLEALGLTAPPEDLTLPVPLLVDSVLCAAAAALDVAPKAVRPALVAAFQRAREMRLSVEAVDLALRPPPAPPVKVAKAKG